MLFSNESGAKLSDFEWHEFIDRGAYGEVFRVTDKASGRVFAIKKIDKFRVKQCNMATQICNEIRIMYEIKHKNIIRIFDHFESQNHLCLVMEYAKASLYKLMVQQGTLPEDLVRSVIRDIVNAIEYLHKKKPPIIHRDIKPSNILIDERDSAKLADFGWSNHAEVLRVTYCGTEPYLAPEMILRQGHDERLDYWCLGVLAYELLSGVLPFTSGMKDQGKSKDQIRDKLHANILNLNYTFPSFFSEAAKSFISGLLQSDRNKRLNIQQMKQHQFLSAKRPIPKVIQKQQQQQQIKEQSQIIRALAEKLNGSEKTSKELKERMFYMSEELKRMNSELAEAVQQLVHSRQTNIKLSSQNKILKEKAEQLEQATARVKQLTQTNKSYEYEIAKLKQDSLIQDQKIAILTKQVSLSKQSTESLEGQYFKLFAQHQQLKLRQSIAKQHQPNTTFKNQNKQLLPLVRSQLQKLCRQVALTRQADLAIQKQLKYAQLQQQITQLKQLEFERQRDFEMMSEDHEARLSDLVNYHNMEIQKLLFTMRDLEDAKNYADMLIDLLLLKL